MSFITQNIPGNLNLNRLFEVDWIGVNMTRWSPTGDYNISVIVDYLHQLPHFDIKLRQINRTTFDPSDNEYLESVGILVAVPGFWLILTLLFFLIFFLCRCCDVNSKKNKSLGCCKCCLFLFSMMAVTVISVGIVGNIRAHSGMEQVRNHTGNIANLVDVLRNETNAVENALETQMDEDLNKISRKLIGPLVRNYTVLNMLQEQLLHMRRNVTKGINRIGEMNSKIERIDLTFLPRTVDQVTPFANYAVLKSNLFFSCLTKKKVETIRWPVTFGLLGSLILFCMLLLCGTCRHSRCLLILFSVLGLLSIVLSFVLTSLYLGIAVGGADFCFNPKPFIAKQLSTAVSPLDTTLVHYYLDCDIRHLYTGPTNNPFRKQLRDIRKSLDGFEEGLFRTADTCENFCPDTEVKATLRELKNQAKRTQDSITLLTRVTECHDVHLDYLFTMSATCRETLEGTILLMISSAGTGILFTFLVLCASHTWINIRKKRPIEVTEETDPFLPMPPSATSTATSSSSKRMPRDTYITASAGGGGGGSGTTGRTARYVNHPYASVVASGQHFDYLSSHAWKRHSLSQSPFSDHSYPHNFDSPPSSPPPPSHTPKHSSSTVQPSAPQYPTWLLSQMPSTRV